MCIFGRKKTFKCPETGNIIYVTNFKIQSLRSFSAVTTCEVDIHSWSHRAVHLRLTLYANYTLIIKTKKLLKLLMVFYT